MPGGGGDEERILGIQPTTAPAGNHHLQNIGPGASGAAQIAFASEALTIINSECLNGPLSTKIQAVTQIPGLLDTYPYKTIINSAFLKLSDLFQAIESNAFRFQVIKVFEASRHHLRRVLHPTEVLQRVLRVVNSNDPMARTMVMGLMGQAAEIFAGLVESQHAVLKGYGIFEDELELLAVVEATERFIQVEPGYLGVVWETLVDRIEQGSEGGVADDETKARMVRVLRHTASLGSKELVRQAVGLCHRWMQRWNDSAVMVGATLSVLSSVVCCPGGEDADVGTVLGRIVEWQREREHAAPQLSIIGPCNRAVQVISEWFLTVGADRMVTNEVAGMGEQICQVISKELDCSGGPEDGLLSLISIYRLLVVLLRMGGDSGSDRIEMVWDLAL
ncbi:Integrator complex subunit 7, partial [Spiromyces aspiralis]